MFDRINCFMNVHQLFRQLWSDFDHSFLSDLIHHFGSPIATKSNSGPPFLMMRGSHGCRGNTLIL